MTVLSPETRHILAEARKALDPVFSNMITAELFEHDTSRGRFKVLPRRDGTYSVFDTSAPNGEGSRGACKTVDEAKALAQACSDEADRRGEPNERELHGWRLKWDDPATWEPVVAYREGKPVVAQLEAKPRKKGKAA